MSFFYDVASHQGTLVVTLIIWIGLFLYLVRLDRRITELEDNVSAAGAKPGSSSGVRGE